MSERELFLDGKIKELEAEKATGASVQRLETIERELSFHRDELEQIGAAKQQRESIISGPQDPEQSFSLESGGFIADFRALAAGEDEYQMLRVTTELYIARLLQAHNTDLNNLRDVEKQKYTALDTELDQTRNDLQDVRGKLEIANNKITDIEIERDNAVSEAESFKKQNEELKSQAAKPSSPTNLDGASSLAEINARIEAKKIPVYDKKDVFRSLDGTYTTFKFAETGEYGEIIWTSFNAKYRLIKEDEVARFRAELEANKADIPEAAEPVPSDLEVIVEPTIEPPTFREPEVSDTLPTDGVAGDAVESESVPDHDGGEVTRAEFTKLQHEVMSRLYNLELAVHGADYVDTGDAA